MSYIRNRHALGAVIGAALPPLMEVARQASAQGTCPPGYMVQSDQTCCPFGTSKNPTTKKCEPIGTCPPGYAKSITTGTCTKLPSDTGAGGRIADFFKGWFQESQTAKGRAAGAAEGASLIAAQQQSGVTTYLPYLLIGGGVLAAVLLLRK